MPKVEVKQNWTHHNEVSLSTLAQGYQGVGPILSQGSGTDSRVGNTINLLGVHFKGALNNNSTSETFVRMMIVGYDSENGDPTVNLFRSNQSGTVSGVSSVNGLDAMYYPVNKVDLHLYYDRVYRLAGSATGNSGANCIFFNKYQKFNGRKVVYKGNTWSYGNQNWMYSIIWIAADANDDTSTGTSVELSCLARTFYKDA